MMCLVIYEQIYNMKHVGWNDSQADQVAGYAWIGMC